MFEAAVIGTVGALCIAWALVCWIDIFNLELWRDQRWKKNKH